MNPPCIVYVYVCKIISLPSQLCSACSSNVLSMYGCSYMHVLIVHMVISTPEKVQIRDPDPRPEYQSDALTIKPFGPLAE